MTSPAREFVPRLSCRDKKGIARAESGLRLRATTHRAIADLDVGPIGPVEHHVLTHRYKAVVFK